MWSASCHRWPPVSRPWLETAHTSQAEPPVAPSDTVAPDASAETPPPVPSEAAVRLAEAIEQAGYTIRTFAREAVGTRASKRRVENERTALQNIIAGRIGLGPVRAQRYAKALSLPPETFLGPRSARERAALLTSLETRVAGLEEGQERIRSQLDQLLAARPGSTDGRAGRRSGRK